MSGSQTFRNKLLIAAAVGTGALIGAAGIYLCAAMQKKESEKAHRLQHRKESFSSQESQTSSMVRSRKSTFCSSQSENDTEDETFFSALSTTDDEYFDLDSSMEKEEENTLVKSKKEKKKKANKLFKEVDSLMKGNDKERFQAFQNLKKNMFEMSDDSEFLWRLAKAHQMQATACRVRNNSREKKQHIHEGLKYVTKALALNDKNAEIHKWFAILTGMQGDELSNRQRIENAHLFHKHILLAMKLKPRDYSLHHLLGRFKFEVAGVSWLEKRIASSLFGEIPDMTYSDAIVDLLKCEELSPTPFKENRLLLAKCYIGDAKYNETVKWLNAAKKVVAKTAEDHALDEEIHCLLEKYRKYQ